MSVPNLCYHSFSERHPRRHLSGVRTQAPSLTAAYLSYVKALDYPPFFAYFEKLLSIPASLIDPKIVDLNNLNYDAWSAIAYQRTTVILTELVLGVVLLRYALTCHPSMRLNIFV